jgi:hypothetical protein
MREQRIRSYSSVIRLQNWEMEIATGFIRLHLREKQMRKIVVRWTRESEWSYMYGWYVESSLNISMINDILVKWRDHSRYSDHLRQHIAILARVMTWINLQNWWPAAKSCFLISAIICTCMKYRNYIRIPNNKITRNNHNTCRSIYLLIGMGIWDSVFTTNLK